MKRSGRTIKDSRFPLSLFAIYYGVLFLMSGIHSGLVTLETAEDGMRSSRLLSP